MERIRNLKCNSVTAKKDDVKLKQCTKQLKTVFTCRIKHKDKKLEQEILKCSRCSPTRVTENLEDFTTLSESNKIISSLIIKKPACSNHFNNILIKYLKSGVFIFYRSSLTCESTITFTPAFGKKKKYS